MFNNTESFNQPIGEWQTANITNIDNMFFGVTLFNLGNLVKQTLVDGITSVQSQSKLVLQTMLVQWMTNQEETKVKCGPPNLWDVSKIRT